MITYDTINIHLHERKYDLVIDTHGNLSRKDYHRMGERGVLVGFTTIGHLILVLLQRAFSNFPLVQFTAQTNTKDLEALASLIQMGKIKVHIEKSYSCKEIPEAIKYIEAKRTKGKVVMVWEGIEGKKILIMKKKAQTANILYSLWRVKLIHSKFWLLAPVCFGRKRMRFENRHKQYAGLLVGKA